MQDATTDHQKLHYLSNCFPVQRVSDVEIQVESLRSFVWKEFCLTPGLRHMCFGFFSYVDVFLTVLKHAKELRNEETARFCGTAILEYEMFSD